MHHISKPAGVQDSRLSYRMAATVDAGESGALEFVFPRDGTLERFEMRQYVGPELALRLVPIVERKQGHREPVVHFIGDKAYLDGDDDKVDFRPNIPCFKGEVLRLEYENVAVVPGGGNAADYAYDFYIVFEIDYANGPLRWPAYGSGRYN